MVIQIVQDVNRKNADKSAQRVCHILKPQEMMFVVILVYKMEVGEKEFILESIEISR